MFSIATMHRPFTQDRLRKHAAQSPDVLCCQSLTHAVTGDVPRPQGETEILSRQYGLTCSCFAPHARNDCAPAASSPEQAAVCGQAIFTGADVWTLNSGRFIISNEAVETVVLFAHVRKGGVSALVMNCRLAAIPIDQECQLGELFQHGLCKEAYGAVMLCTDQQVDIAPDAWLRITAPSGYVPVKMLASSEDGMLSLFAPRQSAPPILIPNRQMPGLSVTAQLQRTMKSSGRRPSFPLSFREQWLGYRDNHVFA